MLLRPQLILLMLVLPHTRARKQPPKSMSLLLENAVARTQNTIAFSKRARSNFDFMVKSLSPTYVAVRAHHGGSIRWFTHLGAISHSVTIAKSLLPRHELHDGKAS